MIYTLRTNLVKLLKSEAGGVHSYHCLIRGKRLMACGSDFREVVRFCDKFDSSAGWLRLVDESTDSYDKRSVCQISKYQGGKKFTNDTIILNFRLTGSLTG
jgi:hypothetical protein